MIGWQSKAKTKAPFRKSTPREKAVERAELRKKIATYMSKADEYDAANLHWADYFLLRRLEYGESSIQIQFALNCFTRLRPEIEL